MADRAQGKRGGEGNSDEAEFHAESDSLWRITLSPVIWALHFVTVYGATAIYCAKLVPDEGAILGLRYGIAAVTVAAVLAIVLIGWRSWKHWGYLKTHDYRHELSVVEHRHRFLGHAAFLLSVISLIAVLYSSLPAIFIGNCA
ncbi:hypothetical protein [Brevirhabdus sp.]|uniref:hypothetical protein n=1 Tax=Brevirhabdus sp. TaxID=2004514 RepID=UPI004058C205